MPPSRSASPVTKTGSNFMTQIEAEFLKNLRCNKPIHSWRRISEVYIETFGGPETLFGDQSYGKELCEQAAKFLNEQEWD